MATLTLEGAITGLGTVGKALSTKLGEINTKRTNFKINSQRIRECWW